MTWFHVATWNTCMVISIPRSRCHIGRLSQLPHEPAAAWQGVSQCLEMLMGTFASSCQNLLSALPGPHLEQHRMFCVKNDETQLMGTRMTRN